MIYIEAKFSLVIIASEDVVVNLLLVLRGANKLVFVLEINTAVLICAIREPSDSSPSTRLSFVASLKDLITLSDQP